MLVGDTRRDMSKPRRPGERPKRKAVVISVLDYPHVGQKHGGSTSGCFTDALLMSRMLSKFYGFTPPTDEGANGTASPSPRQESGASAEAAEKDGIDVQVREGGGRAAAVGVAPLIKVCCTYSWAKGDFSALEGITFENEVYGATGGGAKAKGLTPSSSFAESPGIGSEEDAEDADCDVTHAADTHTEVVRALRWLTEDAKKGDTLLLYFAGCSTYKVVEGGALEPVLCLGDFSWEDGTQGFLSCDHLHELLVDRVRNTACELTVIFDTFLGPSLAQLLEERSKSVDREAYLLTRAKYGYVAFPPNRARVLPLPQREQDEVRKLNRKRKTRARWKQGLRRLGQIAGLLTAPEGERGQLGGVKRLSSLLRRKSSKVSPMPNERFKPPRRATGMVPKMKVKPEVPKVVLLAVESTKPGSWVDKVNRINLVKLGPLTWVLYKLLKGRVVSGDLKEESDSESLSVFIENLHPTLLEVREMGDLYFKHKWRGKARFLLGGNPYRIVVKAWGLGEKGRDDGDDRQWTYRFLSNVHSEQVLANCADRGKHPLESMRALSLTRDMADFIETPPKRAKAAKLTNLLETPEPSNRLAPLKIPPIAEDGAGNGDNRVGLKKLQPLQPLQPLHRKSSAKVDKIVRERKPTTFSPGASRKASTSLGALEELGVSVQGEIEEQVEEAEAEETVFSPIPDLERHRKSSAKVVRTVRERKSTTFRPGSKKTPDSPGLGGLAESAIGEEEEEEEEGV